MIVIRSIEMPKRCAECEFCINKRTSDYGSFGECLLHRNKKVNCLCNFRDSDCLLSEVKQVHTDTNGNAELIVYKSRKECEKYEIN